MNTSTPTEASRQRLRNGVIAASAWLAAACSFAAGSARSTEIDVLDARYSTELSTKVTTIPNFNTGTTVTTTQSQAITRSPEPLDSELRHSAQTYARASADMFSVSTATSAYYDMALNEVSNYALATANTKLTFRPLQDGDASLTFTGLGSGLSFHSDGFFSLYNLTSSQYLFSYSWATPGVASTPPPPGSLPFSFGPSFNASLELNPRLLASNIYELTLHASTNANTDSQHVSMTMSGFASPAPEPSTYALMLAGFGAVGFMIRRNKASPSRRSTV